MNIETLKACQHRAIPLDVDKVVYRGVLGLVTWYAIRRVMNHCASMKLPLKPCTGVFTRSMGLPCAHIVDERKASGGLRPQDFDAHWFWDRNDPRVPLREPRQVQAYSSSQRVANTGRILSSFEADPSTRAPPKCSACHQLGHTRKSKNCPIKLRASIAESNQRLREREEREREEHLNTPARFSSFESPITGGFRTSVPSTPHSELSVISSLQASQPGLLVAGSFRANQPNPGGFQASHPNPGGFQASQPGMSVTDACLPSTPKNEPENKIKHSQKLISQTPILISSSPIGVLSPTKLPTQSVELNSSESQVRVFKVLLSIPDSPSFRPIQAPSPLHLPQLSPSRPLSFDRPEMIYIRYIMDKETWLKENPQVSSDMDMDEYRKARNLPIYHKEILDSWRKYLGLQRCEPSGKPISGQPNWTGEEISAYLDFQDTLEDQLTKQFGEINDAGCKLPSWKDFEEATITDNTELAKRFTL